MQAELSAGSSVSQCASEKTDDTVAARDPDAGLCSRIKPATSVDPSGVTM